MKNLTSIDLMVLCCEKMEEEGFPPSSIKAMKTCIREMKKNAPSIEGWGEAAKGFVGHVASGFKKNMPNLGAIAAKHLGQAANAALYHATGRMPELTNRAMDAAGNFIDRLGSGSHKVEEHPPGFFSRHPVLTAAGSAVAGAGAVGGLVTIGGSHSSNEGLGLDPDLFT